MEEEIQEYLSFHKRTGLFARNTEEAIRMLNNYVVSLVVLQISNLRDAAILKYINENYQHLEVLIMASRDYDDIISIFSKGRYKLSRQTQHLSELKNCIDTYCQVEL